MARVEEGWVDLDWEALATVVEGSAVVATVGMGWADPGWAAVEAVAAK